MWLRAFILALVGLAPAHAKTYGDWQTEIGKRNSEYIVENGAGNRVIVRCDSETAGNHKGTALLIKISGKYPPPNSVVSVSFDEDKIDLPVDKTGVIPTDCRVCSENFVSFWDNARRAKKLLIQFSDGRSSEFSLKGAHKALEPKACATASP